MSGAKKPRSRTADGLRRRLTEAEETLAAIRAGDVDAVVVDGVAGQQVYCLESPDEPFRLFVELMQEGAVTLNGNGTIVYCNPFFANLVQRPLEQVRGSQFTEFVAPDHLHGFQQMLAQAGSESVHGDSCLQVESDQQIPVQLAFNRLPAEHLRMFGVVVTELTERARAEHLDAQRRAAEEAKAARDHFLAVVSHELRTPLNAILGWTQVLRRRDDVPGRVLQGLEVIERNAWAQSQLIEDLLDVSRILAGKLRLELKPTELSAVIKSAVASVQPTADVRQIDIETDVSAGPLQVRGDADRLQQVVWNLLSNAVKFSGDGGRIRVSLAEREGWAEIAVADAGIGISEDFLPMLFELYRQTAASSSRRSGGLGVGLAIVKQLTELHGGEIRAASAGPGQGATFTVRLPLLADSVQEAEETGQPQPTAAMQGVRMLIVEDEADAREMLDHVFTAAGGEVSVAATAGEALERLEQGRFQILISDIGLPDLDGYELIRRVRASGRSGRKLPAVAITAYAGREDRRQAILAGYQVHIAKPLDQDELIAVVANLIGPEAGRID